MRTSKRFLSILLSVAIMATSLIGTVYVGVAAAEISTATNQISSALDFSTMTYNEDTPSATQAIIAAGAAEADNLKLAGNHYPTANPGGYMGEGYYVQKLDAGEGKAVVSATLDLSYFLIDGSPAGYVRVFVSEDGSSWATA